MHHTSLFSFCSQNIHTFTRTHPHTLTSQPPTVCRMCSRATRSSGGEVSMTSLPASPYLLIKALLNSQKLQRGQEQSTHSTTISKHHFFKKKKIHFINSTPDLWHFHMQNTVVCILRIQIWEIQTCKYIYFKWTCCEQTHICKVVAMASASDH